jgi:hypothetical protein
MHGRSCIRLLVMILTPLLLCGQSARVQPDFGFPAPHTIPERPEPGFPSRPVLPPGTLGFPQIARAAGTIFSGTVTAVTRHPATRASAVETVAVSFHVEGAIRGASPGEDLTISQWMGLWSSGQRYRVGERLLVFLYPPSKLGLTSCVAAPLGRFAIDATGRIALSAQQLSALRADPILAGRSRIRLSDMALAVQRAAEEE